MILTLSSMAGRSNRPIWSQENLQNGSSFGSKWVWFRLYLEIDDFKLHCVFHTDGILHVASKVAKPDVIAGICKEEPKGFSTVADHPVSGGAEEAVLQEDHWSLPPRVGLLAVRDPVERQDVAVTRHRPVLLGRVAVTPDQLRLNRGRVRPSNQLSLLSLTVGSSFLG